MPSGGRGGLGRVGCVGWRRMRASLAFVCIKILFTGFAKSFT